MIRTTLREFGPSPEPGGVDSPGVPVSSTFPSASAVLAAEPAPWQPLVSGTVQTKKAEDPTKGLKHLSDQQKQSLRSAVEQDTVAHTLQALTRDWLTQPAPHGAHAAVWAGVRVRDAKNHDETLLVRIDPEGHTSVTKVDNPDQVRKQEKVDEAADALLPSLEQQVAAHPGQAARQAVKVDGKQYVVSLEPNGAERIEKSDNTRATMAIDDEIDKLTLEMAAMPVKQRHKLQETIKVGGDKWKVSLTPEGQASAEKQRGFWGSFLHVITSIVTPIVDVASFFCPALAPVAFGLNALSSGEQLSEGNIFGGILGLAGSACSGVSAFADTAGEAAQAARIGSRVVAGTAGTWGVVQGAERGDVLGALGAAASGVGGSAFGSGSSLGRDLALGSSVAGAIEGNWQSALVGAGMLASGVGPLAGKQFGPSAGQFWLGGSATNLEAGSFGGSLSADAAPSDTGDGAGSPPAPSSSSGGNTPDVHSTIWYGAEGPTSASSPAPTASSAFNGPGNYCVVLPDGTASDAATGALLPTGNPVQDALNWRLQLSQWIANYQPGPTMSAAPPAIRQQLADEKAQQDALRIQAMLNSPFGSMAWLSAYTAGASPQGQDVALGLGQVAEGVALSWAGARAGAATEFLGAQTGASLFPDPAAGNELSGSDTKTEYPSQSGPSSSVQVKPTDPRVRSDLDPQWINSDGGLRWPPNNGVVGPETPGTLNPGTIIDRYGSEMGTYASPAGAPYSFRSLPYNPEALPYQRYEVLKPLNYMGGEVAPWFGQSGGAQQYRFGESIQSLVAQGFLRPVQ